MITAPPQLPSLIEVEEAKQENVEEWLLLEAVEKAWWEIGPAEARQVAVGFEHSPRVAVLLQDLQALGQSAEEFERFWVQNWEENPGFLSAYLAARACQDPDIRGSLAGQSLRFKPDFVQARILRIGARPFRVGDEEGLQRLITILSNHPGCAEGWRLLGHLASLHGRDDIALRAALTEPWVNTHSSEFVMQTKVRAALAAGEFNTALQILDAESAPLSKESRLLLATVLVESGRPEESREVLETLLSSFPQDHNVLFNLGVLYRDYLGNKEQAITYFRIFLEDESGAGLPLPQMLQARLWLKVMTSK
tara:strand:- start:85 stop:1008 length:924 start_codon:yes stop_codon:yes gene_type:complete